MAGFAGIFLHGIARLIGLRVTSWKRSVERNREVGGSPTSLHLNGGAVDVGRESEGWRLAVIKFFSGGRDEDGLHMKGSAPHYHFTASGFTIFYTCALIFVAVRLLKGLLG